MESSQAKRLRKANFSDDELRVLLEAVESEHTTLFSGHSSTITNKLKMETWAKIADKVSSECGFSLVMVGSSLNTATRVANKMLEPITKVVCKTVSPFSLTG